MSESSLVVPRRFDVRGRHLRNRRYGDAILRPPLGGRKQSAANESQLRHEAEAQSVTTTFQTFLRGQRLLRQIQLSPRTLRASYHVSQVCQLLVVASVTPARQWTYDCSRVEGTGVVLQSTGVAWIAIDGFRFEAMLTADVPGWRKTRVALGVVEKIDNSRGSCDTSASLCN